MAIIRTMYKNKKEQDTDVLLKLKEMDKKRSAKAIAAYYLKLKK